MRVLGLGMSPCAVQKLSSTCCLTARLSHLFMYRCCSTPGCMHTVAVHRGGFSATNSEQKSLQVALPIPVSCTTLPPFTTKQP
jgi:hypothetical protein